MMTELELFVLRIPEFKNKTSGQLIDYFAFYCIETDIVCLVPFDENFPVSTLSIRLDDYTGKRLSTMRFASDFSVEKIVNK